MKEAAGSLKGIAGRSKVQMTIPGERK